MGKLSFARTYLYLFAIVDLIFSVGFGLDVQSSEHGLDRMSFLAWTWLHQRYHSYLGSSNAKSPSRSFHPIRDMVGELSLRWVAVTAIMFDPLEYYRNCLLPVRA